MPIRAAVFDLGGVLEIVDDARWQAEWMGRWEDASGAGRGTLMAGASPETVAALDDGSITEQGIRAWCAEALGISADRADAMLADMWDGYCGVLDTQLRDFVVELGRTMATAALSNSADGARREDQRRYGFGDLFDVLVYSHEVGVSKPDAAIYRITEERLGVGPSEIVFLDDRPAYVLGAIQCGWHAVRHVDTAMSIAEIRARITTATA